MKEFLLELQLKIMIGIVWLSDKALADTEGAELLEVNEMTKYRNDALKEIKKIEDRK